MLLIVARQHIHRKPWGTLEGPSVLNPGTIRGSLLQLQEEPSSTKSSQQLRLVFCGELKAQCTCRAEGKAFFEFNKYDSTSHTLGAERIRARWLSYFTAMLLNVYS